MARVIDLNARRAARAEAEGERPILKVGDDEFVLPVELPLAFVEYGTTGEFKKAFGLLVGADNVDKLFAHAITSNDLLDIVRDVYGVDSGEVQASPDSLPNGGATSKPTSKDSTDLTSEKSPTEKKPGVSAES